MSLKKSYGKLLDKKLEEAQKQYREVLTNLKTIENRIAVILKKRFNR